MAIATERKSIGVSAGHKQQWNAIIDRMIRHGATATDAQFDQIVDYLVKYFGPEESKIDSTARMGAKKSEAPRTVRILLSSKGL